MADGNETRAGQLAPFPLSGTPPPPPPSSPPPSPSSSPFICHTHLRCSQCRRRMILLDVVDGVEDANSTPKTTRSDDDSRFTTRRRPESVCNAESESVRRLVLPDYATSQALAGQIPAKRVDDTVLPVWRRRRFWRAVVVAFIIYVVLTICIAVPLLIVRNSRPSHCVSRVYSN